MSTPSYAGIVGYRLSRDGSGTIVLTDGRAGDFSLGEAPWGHDTAIESTTFLPNFHRALISTARGDDIIVDLPRPGRAAPLDGRSSVYLDQNHWSTLAHALHEPDRIRNVAERSAALDVIGRVRRREIVLPLSSAHLSETAKQADNEQRYRRALTQAQLSAGWQLTDALALRRFELRAILGARYRGSAPPLPPPVTLEANAVHAHRPDRQRSDLTELPADIVPMAEALIAACANLDTILGDEPIPMGEAQGWADGFQKFARFLAEDPTGPEMKRQRTNLKFVVDLGRELPEEAARAGVSPEQLSDWTRNHSVQDVARMPALGLYREVIHEKLCDPRLQWESNDLTDMMYLSCASGYCDYVVAERSHASHLNNAARRLERSVHVHRTLHDLVAALSTATA